MSPGSFGTQGYDEELRQLKYTVVEAKYIKRHRVTLTLHTQRHICTYSCQLHPHVLRPSALFKRCLAFASVPGLPVRPASIVPPIDPKRRPPSIKWQARPGKEPRTTDDILGRSKSIAVKLQAHSPLGYIFLYSRLLGRTPVPY